MESPLSPLSPPLDQSATGFSEPRALQCPLERVTELRLVHAASRLVECQLASPPSCPESFPFGGGCFCRALWKFRSSSS
jgi:hypothetical protein